MPNTPPPALSDFVRQVQLVGRSGGKVKQLSGFDRKRHVVPDAANSATLAFFARLCAPELTAETEELFQRARSLLGYRRKELALDLATPQAVLTTSDFVYEIAYELSERSPDSYEIVKRLHQVAAPEVVQRAAFDELFAAQFTEVAFQLRKGVAVEAVVDAVEELEPSRGLRVDYPSDCRNCTLQVEGVEAMVNCDGHTLAMIFPRAGSPRELLEAFAAVRQAFVLTRDRALAGLL